VAHVKRKGDVSVPEIQAARSAEESALTAEIDIASFLYLRRFSYSRFSAAATHVAKLAHILGACPDQPGPDPQGACATDALLEVRKKGCRGRGGCEARAARGAEESVDGISAAA
jgi:hypothetical protein